jgi:hypothetical protein
MIELLKKIYHKLSDYKIVQWAGHLYTNGSPIGNYKAYLRLKNLSKQQKHHGKIRVVFLGQNASVWNKLQSVYEKMVEDDRFEVSLLAIPEHITSVDTKSFDYFFRLYGDRVLNAYIEGRWLDLEGLKPDYVFYQRPYDQYLPMEYRSDVVSRYAKICHVVYGYQVAKTTESSVLNKRFFRNVYMYFAENSIYYEMNRKRFQKSHKEGVRKTLNIGYPALEKFVKQKEEPKAGEKKFHVLWTPRWTEDKDCGGSNFITFKDKVLELVQNKNIFLCFRPHPMTFDHFISVGRITREEVDRYVECYEKSEQMHYDNGASYEKTFWNSDMLLTDVSSVIAEYFLTGKPVVYCETGSVPNQLLEEMMKVFYVVKTWEEAKEKVLALSQGIDPLKEERERKIGELMGSDFEHISQRFLEEIYQDYNS